MKLFVKSDVERAARLAALAAIRGVSIESAVDDSVATVVEETPPYYDEDTVKELLSYFAPPGVTPAQALEEALTYVRR